MDPNIPFRVTASLNTAEGYSTTNRVDLNNCAWLNVNTNTSSSDASVGSVQFPASTAFTLRYSGGTMGVWSLTDLSQLVRDPEDTGDENNPSYQGALILEDNEIFNSKQWGIVVKPTDQDYNNVGEANAASQTYEWHPGSPLLLDYPNSPTQAPGAVIMNNVIADSGQGGIDFEGAPTGVTGTNPVTGHAMPLPVAIVPFGRIVNNTLYGGPTAAGTGIYVANNAAPTLLNNVVVNFQTGINVDPTKGNNSNTVAGYTAYYGNGSDGTYGPANGEQGAIDLTASPFVAPAKYNFYPVRGSQIIDASLNSLTDRQNMLNVKNTVGINPSPILAPAYDLFGQLRISAPPGQGSSGAGLDAYIDIGAINRVDFVGPTAALTNPLDNGPEDLNPANGAVGILGGAATTQFSVVLSDVGTGVDNTTVTSSAVQVFQDQNTEPMAEGQDYFFEYNATNHEINLIPAPGIWATGHTYTIVLNAPGAPTPSRTCRATRSRPISLTERPSSRSTWRIRWRSSPVRRRYPRIP